MCQQSLHCLLNLQSGDIQVSQISIEFSKIQNLAPPQNLPLLQFLFSQVISIIILIKDVQFIIRGLQPPEVQWLRLLSFHCRRHRSRQGQNKTSSGSMLPLYSTMKSANPIKAQYICISHFLSAYYAPGPPWPPCFVCITFSDPGERSPFLNARKLPRTKRLGQTAGGMCTCTAYSPCCIVETNTTL